MTEEQEELIFGKLPKNRMNARSKKNTPEKRKDSLSVTALKSKLGAEPI
jgi:hypothetical protein